MVVLGQSGCIRAKWLYSGKTCCNWAKRFYSAEVVVLGENGCISTKVVVFG